MNNNKAQLAKFYGIVLIGTIFLLFPALYNGYPLLNPDDGTYIHSGFKIEMPGDRPITYGLLLRAFSLNGISLFIAAFFQCWLMSWLLVKNIKLILRDPAKLYPVSIVTIFLLSFLTSLSWISSELIPDVQTSVAFLCLFPLLMQRETKFNTLIFAGLYMISVATHMSNVMIFMFLLAGIWCFRKKLFPEAAFRKNAIRIIWACVILTGSTVVIMAKSARKSKHVFFLGAMLDQGLLKPYLDDHCPTAGYKICAYKDSLPGDANEFLWSENSPLYRTGGWEANKLEYNKIMYGSMKEPKYIWLHIKMSVIFTLRQFKEFNIGDGNFEFPTGHLVNYMVNEHIPRDVNMLNKSRQQQDDFLPNLDIPNKIIYAVVLLSLAVIIVLFFMKGQMYQPYQFFVIAGVMMIVLNIWNCATFAQINGRYGCRVMWLIPLFAIIGVVNYLTGRKLKAQGS
ncbi:hypothetical protein [Taibaiella soli]|uniref:Glycosyltransferase RgtA/B/C/D-like domain-containing protein n=1 Tax=Taibaiella soli TaxID=1649169 RepID=A0A2W2B1P1_9BACT|nr:hypothetical protein [Taibaiella soli]PZF73928.1 hypothetical protein DN068_06200 [Taibaiella soli]